MASYDACGYYEHVCKCIVAYLLNHTQRANLIDRYMHHGHIKSLSQ